MRRPDVRHESPKRLHVLDVDFSLPQLRVDDDATAIVGVVASVDEHVDLPLYSADPADNPRVQGDAKIGR